VGRFAVVLLAAMLAALPGAGAAAQDATPRASPAASPTAGDQVEGLFDVGGGRRLYLRCRGTGGPTVVVDAGGDDDSRSWRSVQRRAAEVTRVCLYDRAGLGESAVAAPSEGRTPRDLIADLRALLAAAGERGPYVLVAHSIAGLTARQFAAEHPAEVAGLVLVDANPPGFVLAAPEQLRAFFGGDNLERVDWVASAEAVAELAPPAVPVVVLVAELNTANDWHRWQEEQAAELGVEPVVVPGVGHRIQAERYPAVAEAIRQVVEAARGPGAGATPTAGTPSA
jgi:pimeloyl-ACP methyl ester carboxylesterase